MLKPEVRLRTVRQDVLDYLLSKDVPHYLARIIAARPCPEDPVESAFIWQPKLSCLDSPFLLKDMDKAVTRLRQAIVSGEVIGIETDHDCDGQTSHAVLWEGLTQVLGVPESKLRSYIGHRMEEGYGLSQKLAERILEDDPRPSLIITADNGSSDEPRIAQLKKADIDVVVTDHHHLPEAGPPASAFAVINPTQDDCNFPDPFIAGCMVSWLLLAATRRAMIEAGELPDSAPSMVSTLDFVAVGTVADCVSLSRSVNNRAVVQAGLKKIKQLNRPCWQAIQPLLGERELNSQDLGFLIGPMLNSDGRLGDAFNAVQFLLSNDTLQAQEWAQILWTSNEERKAIQRTLTEQAMCEAEHQVALGRSSIVVYLKEGHAGVHGISASRLKDHFGRPVILFSPKLNAEGVITGSARSIDTLHMRDALQAVATTFPGLLISFGGHAGAAGLALKEADFERFSSAFEKVVQEQLAHQDLRPIIFSDGPIDSGLVALETVDALRQLEPFGREFDAPVFEIEGQVLSVQAMGKTKNHFRLRLGLLGSGEIVNAVWFNACEPFGEVDVAPGGHYSLLVQLQDNVYRGARSLQLLVVGVVER